MRFAAGGVAALLLVSCVPPGSAPLKNGFAPSHRASGATCTISCIQHVVVVIQENRSLDNLFGDPRGHVPGLRRHTTGIANCPSILVNPNIKLAAVKLEYPKDVNHSWASSLKSFDQGKMDGFCYDAFYYDPPSLPYAYVPDTPDEAGPYWQMASQYVIADQMFPTEFGASFTSHLMLVAGNDDLTAGNDALVDPGPSCRRLRGLRNAPSSARSSS